MSAPSPTRRQRQPALAPQAQPTATDEPAGAGTAGAGQTDPEPEATPLQQVVLATVSYARTIATNAVDDLRTALSQLRTISQTARDPEAIRLVNQAIGEVRDQVTDLMLPSKALRAYIHGLHELLRIQMDAMAETERVQRGAFRSGHLGAVVIRLRDLLLAYQAGDQWDTRLLDRLFLEIDHPHVQGVTLHSGHPEFPYQYDLAVYACLIRVMSEVRGLCAAHSTEGQDEVAALGVALEAHHLDHSALNDSSFAEEQ